ncbi:MAG: hypothetical protein IJR50_04620 [Treponema sp.]|nr:hypothetical protein [Treponema sp.]
MDNCKYSNNVCIDGIKHEICSNEELKTINKTDGKNIPCMGPKCGKFEEKKEYKDERN